MAGSDYEHWESESSSPESNESTVVASTTVSMATGYDSQNGLRKQCYDPANHDKKDKRDKNDSEAEQPIANVCEPPSAVQTQAQPPQQVYYMIGGYSPMQYAPYPQQMASPAPAYYGYPQGYQQGGFPYNGVQVCYPALAAPLGEKNEEKKKKKDKPAVKKWQGRTKAEVEEDNMKIAAQENVCAPRKVVPKDLKEDQMVWCVETDGSHTLRTFAAVKEFGGEWKADPRFKDSWYFVREEEAEKEKE